MSQRIIENFQFAKHGLITIYQDRSMLEPLIYIVEDVLESFMFNCLIQTWRRRLYTVYRPILGYLETHQHYNVLLKSLYLILTICAGEPEYMLVLDECKIDEKFSNVIENEKEKNILAQIANIDLS